jgi:nucleoside-diphosphate-sugar epimerase
MSSILVTGGAGYTGTVLVSRLLNDGHSVVVVDTGWFGNHLPAHERLRYVEEDTRIVAEGVMRGVHAVVHLANIANDPAVDLTPSLSWEVNVLATKRLADMAVANGVRQFIFASSGSVYGVSDLPRVTEDAPLLPISVYNKTKMVAERVLLSYSDSMAVHLIRPATVCGWSPRMRLDVSVNMLTAQALNNGRITVFGGSQIRPNIHIEDLARAYQHFLKYPTLPSGPYNAGFENLSIASIAESIQRRTNCEIAVMESNDPRSYRQDSAKLLATGFAPTRSVADAIDELVSRHAQGELEDRPEHHTVKWMRYLNLAQ